MLSRLFSLVVGVILLSLAILSVNIAFSQTYSNPPTGYPASSPGVPGTNTQYTAPTTTVPVQQQNQQQPGYAVTSPQPQAGQLPAGQQPYPYTPPSAPQSNPNPGSQVIPARPVGEVPGVAPQQTGPAQPVQNQSLQAPFQLTPLEQQQLEHFLANWERKCQTVKVMECEFEKWEYDSAIVGDMSKPVYITYGVAKYEVPDRGLFWEQGEIVNGNKYVKGQRESKVVCDGKSFYYFNYPVKDVKGTIVTPGEVVEFPIPNDIRQSRKLESPIMFVVGAKPQELKDRFFLRLSPHPNPDMIVLEAHPKWQDDAKEFRLVQIIVYAKNYDPYGMKQYHVTGTGATTFVIRKSEINPKDSFIQKLPGMLGGIGGGNEFDNVLRTVPSGWTHRIETIPTATASPQPTPGMR